MSDAVEGQGVLTIASVYVAYDVNLDGTAEANTRSAAVFSGPRNY
jgi:hypothetical protein